MRIARVIGTVTVNRAHPSLGGGRYRLVVPLPLSELPAVIAGAMPPAALEPIVAYDDLGAGDDSLVALSEGGEAAQPFAPEDKPVDCYCAAILDRLDVTPLDRFEPAE